MTCYVIDDEQSAINVLNRYIEKTSSLSFLGCSLNALGALSEFKNLPPVDLIFLDVDMPDLSGLELIELLPPNVKVILTTAHSNYAVAAFELNVLDFLLKPISFPKFLKAVSKAESLYAIEKDRKQDSQQNAMFINPGVRGKVIQVHFNEILYIEGLKNYVIIYVNSGEKFITYLTMNEILTALPQTQFCRVHKSHIVNIYKIRAIEGNVIYLLSNIKVPVGVSYKESFSKVILASTVKSSRKKP
jgi:two-component system, LytTR family, response regulator